MFEFFETKKLITMQRLNKKFYSYICPSICPRVPIPKKVDFTEQMREQVTRVMLFSKQRNMYTFSAETNFKWVEQPLVTIDPEKDYKFCPTEWPKHC